MEGVVKNLLPAILVVSAVCTGVTWLTTFILSGLFTSLNLKSGFFGSTSLSPYVSGVFSLNPELFIFYWLPFFVALFALLEFQKVIQKKENRLCKYPLVLAVFCLLSGLFLNLPYAAGVGIICASINFVLALICIILTITLALNKRENV